MASGVPIVATNLPGYRTVLTPGVQGLTVAPRDPIALRAALQSLLESPGQRKEMGARGIETSRHYAWPSIVEKLEEIYGSLVGPGRTTSRIRDLSERPSFLEPAEA
jgi:phosphatidylinositol alpha-mannosyltransferase